MPEWSSFASRLQWLALKKKVVQADLVIALKQNSATISRWWNGNVIPGTKNIRLIAEYFCCDVDWLASGRGAPFHGSGNGESSITLIGNGSVMAGRHIKGNVTLGSQEQSALVLTAEERELVFLLREVGGKKVLKKFKDELERIKAFIEENT